MLVWVLQEGEDTKMEKIPVKEKTLCVMAQELSELSDSNTGLTLWRREGRKVGWL